MIDTPKPVAASAEVNAHFCVAVVISTRPTDIENISANVSTIREMLPVWRCLAMSSSPSRSMTSIDRSC